jgi:cytidine deaminase
MHEIERLIDAATLHYAQGTYVLSALHAEAALFLCSTNSTAPPIELTTLATQYPQPFAHYQSLLHTAKESALATRMKAHAPFSNFLVGATLIAEDETLFTGCNVEASSYGLTICAERTALVSGVAQGYKRFVGVVVAADTPVLTPPCGACRQMLYDFAPDAVVLLINLHGVERRFTMRELLPEAFTVEFLR